MASRRLYIHIGLQKTGTSYLQGTMLGNADELARQGLDLVPATKRDTFELMLLVRDRYHEGRDPDTVPAALDRFTGELSKARGPAALLSQESLAAARPAQVERLLEACRDREVHVVATVRDLGRQLPSSWQQELKAGRTDGYGRYLKRLRTLQEEGRGTHPWIHLDPPAVLARWAAHVPADRVHVVTVPPRGSSPTLLLERFCGVIGIDPGRLVPEARPANTSLGRVQAEVLRLVNAGLPDDVLRRQVYGDVGKRYFAARVLGPQDSRRILVPASLRSWCDQVAEEQITALAGAGYDVVGDLAELRCGEEAFSDEESPPDVQEVADAAVAAIATMLTQRATTADGPARQQPAGRRRDRRLGRRRA